MGHAQDVESPAASSMVVADGLSKQYGEMAAVSDLSLSVREGEVVALLGPNGAGKTTTVRMLASIIKPTAGTATIAGLDVVSDAQRVRSMVGLLTEFPGLYKRMRAVEYLDFYGQLHGLSPSLRRDRIGLLLQRFDLWGSRELQLGHYSKGMAQKLALTRAMLHDPRVLFLDEPTSAMDPHSAAQKLALTRAMLHDPRVLFLDEPTSAMDPHSARLVRDTIRWLKEQGKAIIICTHNLAEAHELADRVAIIRGGEIVAVGTLDQLRSRYLYGTLCELRLAGSSNGLDAVVKPFVEMVSSGENWLRYRTVDYERTNPLVLDALVRAGASIVTLSVVASSLEDVYLSLIGEQEAHDSSIAERHDRKRLT